MKVIRQTGDQMVLKDGNAASVIIGILLIVAGGGAFYYVRSSSGIVGILVAAGLLVAGVLLSLLSTSITVTLDKARGQIGYEKKRLTGLRSATYAVADVLRIETRKEWHVQNSTVNGRSIPQQTLVAQSVIIFKDGQQLPLDHIKNGSTSVNGILMSGQGA